MRLNRIMSFTTQTAKGKCLAVPPKQLLLYGQEPGPLAGVYLFYKHAVYVQAAAVFECCDKPRVYSEYKSPVISTVHNTASLQQKTWWKRPKLIYKYNPIYRKSSISSQGSKEWGRVGRLSSWLNMGHQKLNGITTHREKNKRNIQDN